jgi:hypothetical protein
VVALTAAARSENPAPQEINPEYDSMKGNSPVNINPQYAPHNHEHRRLDHKKSDSKGPLFQYHLQRLIRKFQRQVYRVLFRSIPNRGTKEVDLSKLRNNQVHDEKR